MAALEAEHFRRAADVAMIFVQFFENVVALIRRPSLVQRGSLAARRSSDAVAMHQWRKMLTFKSRSSGVHDHDALDHIAQLADVPPPRRADQFVDAIVGDLSWAPSIGRGKFLQKMPRKQRDVFLAFAQRRH